MSAELAIFGENGAILNADEMKPQSEWKKPEPQGLTRQQLKRFMIAMAIVLTVTTVSMIWIIP